MLGQLASALAHEINQPLGAILRNAEAAELHMQNQSPDLEELRAILGDIQKDDQRAVAVIDRMRSLLGRRELNREPLLLRDRIEDLLNLVRSDAATRQVRLDLDVPVDLPPVCADRVHFQQVLLNLIMNAMDALNEQHPDARCVVVSARHDGGAAVDIAVRDSGPGLPAGHLSKVFDSFYTTKPEGMGMGLAISRTIIEAHGGRIWAENNPEGGATFRFTLPTPKANITA
jgi:signal transduction histidine kinase